MPKEVMVQRTKNWFDTEWGTKHAEDVVIVSVKMKESRRTLQSQGEFREDRTGNISDSCQH